MPGPAWPIATGAAGRRPTHPGRAPWRTGWSTGRRTRRTARWRTWRSSSGAHRAPAREPHVHIVHIGAIFRRRRRRAMAAAPELFADRPLTVAKERNPGRTNSRIKNKTALPLAFCVPKPKSYTRPPGCSKPTPLWCRCWVTPQAATHPYKGCARGAPTSARHVGGSVPGTHKKFTHSRPAPGCTAGAARLCRAGKPTGSLAPKQASSGRRASNARHPAATVTCRCGTLFPPTRQPS